MATITKFEDLEVWKQARALCLKIRTLTNKDSFKRDFGLRQQMLNSSGSIMDNITEGFERDGKKEFLQFLYIAKGSLGELKSQLYRSLDSALINKEEFEDTSLDAEILLKGLGGFIKYLYNSEYKGIKYRTTNTTN